jgi:hypothetical protein
VLFGSKAIGGGAIPEIERTGMPSLYGVLLRLVYEAQSMQEW